MVNLRVTIRHGEEWARYRTLLNPLLMKTGAFNHHFESLEFVAEQLLDSWQPKRPSEKATIGNLERDLYCYLVQVRKILKFKLNLQFETEYLNFKGLMCVTFGRKIGLDRSLVDAYAPDMARHLHTLFVQSARMTLISPSLASKLRLRVWKEFEQAAISALETALQLTDVCLDQKPGEDDSCIVTSLQKHQIAHDDIRRLVADLFIAASDTVRAKVLLSSACT